MYLAWNAKIKPQSVSLPVVCKTFTTWTSAFYSFRVSPKSYWNIYGMTILVVVIINEMKIICQSSLKYSQIFLKSLQFKMSAKV